MKLMMLMKNVGARFVKRKSKKKIVITLFYDSRGRRRRKD